jgi:patatin-related protein
VHSENSPISEAGQEIRFAVAMSGGVSLAVWMGGVAREINLLQQASNLREQQNSPASADGAAPAPDWDEKCRELYRQLLTLLNVTVTTDVLSGTSAGGINAALLGLAGVTGADLGGLRDLWLTTGSMDMLLRDPGEPNPPSLMQGDKVLFTQLNRGIKDFYDNRSDRFKSRTPVSTTVFITTTMITGETSRFTDDYGTLVPDVDHHGLFTFDDNALGANGNDPDLTALALAARSSASFPGAFEPSFVPVNSSIPASSGVPRHPDMAAYANMTRGHWAADGGLLANRPLTPLLAKVFAQPATGQVRRVLAFVVPDGGGASRATAAPVSDDDYTKPLTMVAALKADLGAQLSQSIASDLEATRTHNERINARYDLRRSLAELGSRLRDDDQPPDGSPPSSDGLMTGRMLRDFERQQGSGLAQPLLAEVMRQLTTMPIPAAWADELAPGGKDQSGPAEPRMAKEMVHILGRGWRPQPAPLTTDEPAAANGAAAAAPSPASEEVAAWTAWNDVTEPYQRAARFGLPVFQAAQAAAVRLIRLGYRRATTSDARNMLAGHRKAIKEAAAALPPGPPGERRWTGERDQVRAYLQQAASETLATAAEKMADLNRQGLLIGDEGAAGLTGCWKSLATAVQGLLSDLASMTDPTSRASRAEAGGKIDVYLRYFGAGAQPPQVADRLLKLMLAERALLPADAELDQPVEFVQFSANTRTPLAPADDSLPASQQLDSVTKLRGVELHHFAAFYKSSWRAWDWMWGRLDGCGWLVHILLDPARILAVVENQPEEFPEHHRAERFAQKLRDAIGLPGNLPDDCLATDLAFLDNHDADIPVSLPDSALFIARAWQNLIAANELPTVAERMVADSGRLPGQQSMSASPDAWITRMSNLKNGKASPAEFARELPRCPVRQETLAGELRTPAFARLAAKAAAVATAAAATAPEAPGAVRPVLSSARTVTRTGYLATKVTNGSGWITLLAGVLLAVIGVVLATQGMLAVGLSGTIVALVGAYLIALGAWGIHKGALTAIAVITAVALPVLLTVHWVRIELWGNGKDINNGWVPRDVLPWLRDNWWAGLAVLGGILVLAILISLIPRRRPPRNPPPAKAPGPPASPASVSTDSPASGGKPAGAAAQAPAPAATPVGTSGAAGQLPAR